jgi:hypothetical protein
VYGRPAAAEPPEDAYPPAAPPATTPASARVSPPQAPHSPADPYAEPTGIFQGPPPNEDRSAGQPYPQSGFAPAPVSPPGQGFGPQAGMQQGGFGAGQPAAYAQPHGAPQEYGTPYGQQGFGPDGPAQAGGPQSYGQGGHQGFGPVGGAQSGPNATSQMNLPHGTAQLGPVPGFTEAEADQGRFDSFKAEEPPAEPPPTPARERNGRVLAMVLVAAVLILAVPLGLVWLLSGGSDSAFDPEVGSCVKQSGNGAVAAQCSDASAFTVVSKVDSKAKCEDQSQPHIVIAGDGGKDQVLCLKPAAGS